MGRLQQVSARTGQGIRQRSHNVLAEKQKQLTKSIVKFITFCYYVSVAKGNWGGS